MAIYPVFLKNQDTSFFYRLMLDGWFNDGLPVSSCTTLLLLIFDSSTTGLVICDIHTYSIYIVRTVVSSFSSHQL
jgi:hypothetical protein